MAKKIDRKRDAAWSRRQPLDFKKTQLENKGRRKLDSRVKENKAI